MSNRAAYKGLTRSAVLWRKLLRRLGKPDIRIGVTVTVVLGFTLPAVCLATLPDGRVYEEVSPANKNGNVVVNKFFGLSSQDGNAVVFVGTGGMGAASSSGIDDSVSRRSAAGWQTSSAVPPALGNVSPLSRPPLTLVPSQDFSSFLFGAFAPYVSGEALEALGSVNIFVSDDPTKEPEWVGRPTAQSPGFNPLPPPGQNDALHDYLIAGGTPNLSTVYFTYSGTLIPQDALRTPNVGDGQGDDETDPWGFYEWSGGILREAGVLPDGTLDPFGAVPAAIAGGNNFERVLSKPFDQAQTLDNEISVDGSRAFFVSPDPVASTATDKSECEKAGPCTSSVPELYLRKTAPDGTKSTVLVSRSQLPGHEGEAAPNGPMRVPDAQHARFNQSEPVGETYVYGSPDGSQAFFASVDQLTSTAPVDGTAKEYDFNVNTGSLTYLPGVTGPVVVSSRDGSSFIFENTVAEPAELEFWKNGPVGGEVTQIKPLPADSEGGLDIDGARATGDGSVFVFRTSSALSGGFNNGGGGIMQVYRFASTSKHLDCVSCPPLGITPSGDAQVSYNNAGTGNAGSENGGNGDPMSTLDTRALSADGGRVFFDTPDPLVTQDSNDRTDVYEWENGKVFLISSGKSDEESNFLDASANGDDVFFTTSLGLAVGDRDTGYDVYDARVPHPGDSPPPSVLPCQGDVCQGPPSAPSLLGASPSATFNGIGNITSPKIQPLAKKKPPKTKSKHHHKKKVRKKNRVKKSSTGVNPSRSISQRGGR